MSSVDWNDGNGTVEWNTGLDYWSATPIIVDAYTVASNLEKQVKKHQDCARLVLRAYPQPLTEATGLLVDYDTTLMSLLTGASVIGSSYELRLVSTVI